MVDEYVNKLKADGYQVFINYDAGFVKINDMVFVFRDECELLNTMSAFYFGATTARIKYGVDTHMGEGHV